MTTAEVIDTKHRLRRHLRMLIGIIVFFGVVNIAGFVANRYQIAELNRRVDACEMMCGATCGQR